MMKEDKARSPTKAYQVYVDNRRNVMAGDNVVYLKKKEKVDGEKCEMMSETLYSDGVILCLHFPFLSLVLQDGILFFYCRETWTLLHLFPRRIAN